MTTSTRTYTTLRDSIIRALGLESKLNLPAVASDQVIGTDNLLHEEGHFTPARVEAAMALQPVVTLAFLPLHHAGAATGTLHPADQTIPVGVRSKGC